MQALGQLRDMACRSGKSRVSKMDEEQDTNQGQRVKELGSLAAISYISESQNRAVVQCTTICLVMCKL